MYSSKKAQASIITAVVITIALIILVPISIKIIGAITSKLITIPFISGDADAMRIINSMNNNWRLLADWFAISIYFFLVILIIYSSFMVPVHFAFVVIYIIGSALSLMVSYLLQQAAITIVTSPQLSAEMLMVTKTSFLLTHLITITCVVIFLAGFIMYSKLGTSNSAVSPIRKV